MSPAGWKGDRVGVGVRPFLPPQNDVDTWHAGVPTRNPEGSNDSKTNHAISGPPHIRCVLSCSKKKPENESSTVLKIESKPFPSSYLRWGLKRSRSLKVTAYSTGRNSTNYHPTVNEKQSCIRKRKRSRWSVPTTDLRTPRDERTMWQ